MSYNRKKRVKAAIKKTQELVESYNSIKNVVEFSGILKNSCMFSKFLKTISWDYFNSGEATEDELAHGIPKLDYHSVCVHEINPSDNKISFSYKRSDNHFLDSQILKTILENYQCISYCTIKLERPVRANPSYLVEVIFPNNSKLRKSFTGEIADLFDKRVHEERTAIDGIISDLEQEILDLQSQIKEYKIDKDNIEETVYESIKEVLL